MATYRQATLSDVHNIAAIFNEYRTHFGGTSNIAASETFLFKRFERRDSVMFVSEYEGEIIGIAHLYLHFSSLSLKRVWILNDFYIVENMRSKRIGEELFCTVKDFVAKTYAKGIELSAEHANIGGWKFWERQGFEIDSKFRHYFLKM